MEFLLSTVSGIVIPRILNYLFELPINFDGVEHYAIVHKSKFNCVVHTIGMPIFSYGILLLIPRLLKLKHRTAVNLQWFIYGSYMSHYLSFSWIGALVALVYLAPLSTASWTYRRYMPITPIVELCVCVMTVQELVGHHLGGDPQSRITLFDISNAIMYAIYFSVGHFFIG